MNTSNLIFQQQQPTAGALHLWAVGCYFYKGIIYSKAIVPQLFSSSSVHISGKNTIRL